jgi:broad specificity phosphatase PhoE
MPAPTIYYIRHGETDWNASGRLQGAQDVALNGRGIEQAIHVGAVLEDLFARDGRDAPSFAFVASPLGRARRTMELVRRTLRLPPDDYAVDERLREIGYGQWEGATLVEAQARDPDLFERRFVDKWTVAAPDGESYAEVQTRVSAWYTQVRLDTVAVAHGGTARALMVALGFESPQSAADLIIEQGAVYVFGRTGLSKYS